MKIRSNLPKTFTLSTFRSNTGASSGVLIRKSVFVESLKLFAPQQCLSYTLIRSSVEQKGKRTPLVLFHFCYTRVKFVSTLLKAGKIPKHNQMMIMYSKTAKYTVR